MPIPSESIGYIPKISGGPSRTRTPTVNASVAALVPYLADAHAHTGAVPGASGITVLGRVSTLREYDRDSRPTFSVAPNLGTTRRLIRSNRSGI